MQQFDSADNERVRGHYFAQPRRTVSLRLGQLQFCTAVLLPAWISLPSVAWLVAASIWLLLVAAELCRMLFDRVNTPLLRSKSQVATAHLRAILWRLWLVAFGLHMFRIAAACT